MDRINIAELQAGSRTTTLPNGVTATYRPTLITAPVMNDIQRLMKAEKALPLAKMLCKIVREWDLVGPVESLRFDDETDDVIETVHVAAGKPVPLEPEIVQHVNALVLSSILLEVAADAIPNLETATP